MATLRTPRRGFSITEMVVVIAITSIFISFASFGYITMTQRVVVDNAAKTVSQLLKSARTAAVATRTARRVVLDLQNETIFVERKWFEQFEFDDMVSDRAIPGGDTVPNRRRIGEPVKLRDGADIVDVSGWSIDDIPSEQKYYYIEFDRQGRNARGYRNGTRLGPNAVYGEGMSIHVARNLIRIPLAEDFDGSMIATDEGRRTTMRGTLSGRRYYNPAVAENPRHPTQGNPALQTAATQPLWDRQSNNSRLNDDDMLGVMTARQVDAFERGTDYPADLFRVHVAQEARSLVHTIEVLPITGQVHTFPYAKGFPWRNEELRDDLGGAL